MKATPFNKPYLTGKEAHYMYDAVDTGKLSVTVNTLKNASVGLKKPMALVNVC